MKNNLTLKSVNLEEDFLKRENSSIPKKRSNDFKNMNIDYFNRLIEESNDGLARFLIQIELHKDPENSELLELILKTDDENVSIFQYIEWCNELLELFPENKFALNKILRLRNKKDKIRQKKEVKITIMNKNKNGIRDVIQEEIANDRLDEALILVNGILDKDNENKYAKRTKAIIYTKGKNFDLAAFYWSEWIESGHASIEDYFRTARSHYNAKHFNQVLEILNEIYDDYDDKEAILDLSIRSNYSLFNWDICFKNSEELLEINKRNKTGLKYRRLTLNKIQNLIKINNHEDFESHNYENMKIEKSEFYNERDALPNNIGFMRWYEYI
jgi:tetratricopeptide (TPR) repeat protein